jgi:hypothetical protein
MIRPHKSQQPKSHRGVPHPSLQEGWDAAHDQALRTPLRTETHAREINIAVVSVVGAGLRPALFAVSGIADLRIGALQFVLAFDVAFAHD